MKVFTGTLNELGDSTSLVDGGESFRMYSYVQLNDQIIKPLGVRGGVDGKLRQCLDHSSEITIFTKRNILVGLKHPDGKTYAPDFGSRDKTIFKICAAFSVLTIPFFGIGLIIGLMTYLKFWPAVQIINAANSIPGAIRL